MSHILITGGSDGIGLTGARLVAADNAARVTLVARNEGKLKEAVASLPGIRSTTTSSSTTRVWVSRADSLSCHWKINCG